MALSPYRHATDEHVDKDRYLKSPRVLEQIVVKSTLHTLAVPSICGCVHAVSDAPAYSQESIDLEH